MMISDFSRARKRNWWAAFKNDWAPPKKKNGRLFEWPDYLFSYSLIKRKS
jgi:hypothetical protein